MPKAAKKYTMEFVPAKSKPELFFDVTMARKGIYAEKVQYLLEHPEEFLKIRADDPSTLMQLRKQAGKAGAKLAFAREGEYLFIKCIRMSDDQRRLMLLLREPRSMSYLEAQKLELRITREVEDLFRRGWAEKTKAGDWKLTEQGVNAIGL